MRSIEKPSPFDEPQREHVRLRVDTITAGAAVRGRDQARRFVIADGLCRYARCARSLANVHGWLPLVAADEANKGSS